MEDYQNNRQIRVFISSTFSDMQEEREYLFYNVFPKVRKVAESRDVKLVEIDLRWGITYEESSNGKVLEICFKEIGNCRPYFIGILGDRYGWCPEIN
jgi:preprotein translocase subunit SecA/nephrocystin-3